MTICHMKLHIRGHHSGQWTADLPLPPRQAVAEGAGEVPQAGHLPPHAGHGQAFW